MDIIKRAALVREKIKDTFGKPPPPGPERENYYKGIKENLDIDSSGKLAQSIMSVGMNEEHILNLFSGKALCDLIQAFNAIEEKL